MASTTIERPLDCPLQRAAAGVAVIWPERYCFGDSVRPEGAQGHVLVVDTDPQLAALTARMLSDLGYDARWCPDTRDALDLMDHGHPADLLLAPECDADIADAARARRPALRVLLTHGSGHRCPDAAPHADRLAKPFNRARLQRKVHEVLDRSPSDHAAAPTA